MSEWQPIETYDALKKRPEFAVFWFQKDIGSRFVLPATTNLSRSMGRRICTHWMPTPKAPDAE